MKKVKLTDREIFNINFSNNTQGSVCYNPNDPSKEIILNSFKLGYSKASNFFGFTVPKIKLIIVYSREELDKLFGIKSSDWFVGYANSFNQIIMLSESVFEKESIHKKKDFEKVMCHEISHLFIRQIHKSHEPIWLDEGLAYLVAGQVSYSKRIDNTSFIVNPKMVFFLDTRKKWDKSLAYDPHATYALSFLFVKFLIAHFDKEKILRLLKKLPIRYNQKQFRVDFKEVYKIDITKIVEQFLFILRTRGGDTYVTGIQTE